MIKLRRTKRAPRTPDASMPMLEHLAELRNRSIISVAAVLAGAIVAFAFYDPITNFLLDFYRDSINNGEITFIFTGPADAFITPALDPKEKRYAVPFVLSAIVLFALGAFVAFLTLEPALNFLLNIGGTAQRPLLTYDKYLTLVALMVVAFGLSFEFPIVLVFLLIACIITTAQLRHARRWA